MKKLQRVTAMMAFLLLVGMSLSHAQLRWVVGGNLGLSIGSGGGSSSVGLHFGPMGELEFTKDMAVGSELNINTQGGTPVEWADYYKYYFTVSGSEVRPYADGGLGLWFMTGGPYFGLRFGGGVNIPVARNLAVAPDLQLGPVFTKGSTTFAFLIRCGLRYTL